MISQSEAWAALQKHHGQVRDIHLRTLFAEDPKRGERLALEAASLYLDYSKNRVTDETLRLLLALAEAADLRARIDAMFSGEKINVTEQRAVLHVALRAPRETFTPAAPKAKAGDEARVEAIRRDPQYRAGNKALVQEMNALMARLHPGTEN